ncbi:MAG: flippase-like domain-containing protein [Acetatifactor sp.]|nr:flippase-like domain-containing protein [Acetatifactor sp.]
MKITKHNPGELGRNQQQSFRKYGKYLVLLLLLVSMFLYRERLGEIFAGVKDVTKAVVCKCIILSAAAYALEGMTIAFMMGTAGGRPRAGKGISIGLLCEFYRMITLGNGSGFAEIHYIHKNGIEAGKAAAMTMIQYAFKRIAVMILGSIGFLILYLGQGTRQLCREYMPYMGTGILISLMIAACFFCLALSPKIAGCAVSVLKWLSRKFSIIEKKASSWIEQIILLNRSGKSILGKKREMMRVIMCQVGKQLLFCSIPAVMLQGKSQLAVNECIWLMAAACLLAGVIPAPSGAGSLEFVFILFFSRFSEPGVPAAAILIFRFVTWVLPFMAGGLLIIREKYFTYRWNDND